MLVRLEEAQSELEQFGPQVTSGPEEEIPTRSVQSPVCL